MTNACLSIQQPQDRDTRESAVAQHYHSNITTGDYWPGTRDTRCTLTELCYGRPTPQGSSNHQVSNKTSVPPTRNVTTHLAPQDQTHQHNNPYTLLHKQKIGPTITETQQPTSKELAPTTHT